VSTKERILDEAERLIAKHGLDDLRLRDIADAIGIRVPSIYGHFESRDAVRYGVVERYVADSADLFSFDPEQDPVEALRAGIHAYVNLLVTRPAFVRLELRDLEKPDGWHELNVAFAAEPADLESGPVAPMYARVGAILAEGRRRRDFRDISFVTFWRALIGVCLASLTWPDESALRDGASSPAMQALIAEIETTLFRVVCTG
jgi:AcrR family transcriptional regulator